MFVIGGVLAGLTLVYFAYSRPGYFTSEEYLGTLIGLEAMVALTWFYRRVFFAGLVFVFLLAGANVPGGGGIWTRARWVLLGVGALVGVILAYRERCLRMRYFHLLALLAVMSSAVSITVSRYSVFTLLKVLSLLLLFAYTSTGARLAVAGREERFSRALLKGCELFVGANAILYALGVAAMGNPNSLGAVMAIVGAPILLWSLTLGGRPPVYGRRLILFAACTYLLFMSQSRSGLLAALISTTVLCVALKRYRLFLQGAVLLVIVISAMGLFRPEFIPHFASSVVYKNASGQILASRESTWQQAVDTISEHPWFGVGLGTTKEDSASANEMFSSSTELTKENGSSYLAILAGTGIVGAFCWFLMLLVLLGTIIKVVLWMRTSRGNALHPAIPIARVVLGGLAHAAFEDWMFAPGNYLCVFFWCMVFILDDVVPWRFGWQSHNNSERYVFGARTNVAFQQSK